MNILSSMQAWLETCPGIDLVHIDTAEERPSNYAVALAGNSKISEDLAGNKTYRYSFVFYCREYTCSDAERKDNHDFLQDFADWVEAQDDAGNYPELPAGCEPESMEVANTLLMDVDEDGSKGLYQVQLNLTYTKGAN